MCMTTCYCMVCMDLFKKKITLIANIYLSLSPSHRPFLAVSVPNVATGQTFKAWVQKKSHSQAVGLSPDDITWPKDTKPGFHTEMFTHLPQSANTGHGDEWKARAGRERRVNPSLIRGSEEEASAKPRPSCLCRVWSPLSSLMESGCNLRNHWAELRWEWAQSVDSCHPIPGFYRSPSPSFPARASC